MKNKTYLKIIIAAIIIIVVFASYQIITLQNEIKELKAENAELLDYQECEEHYLDNENMVLIHIDEQEEYCRDILKE